MYSEWTITKGPSVVLYLDDRIAKLQGVHELGQRWEKEPVVPQEAVPLLAFLL